MHTQDLLQHILEQLFLRTHTDPQNVHENKTTVKINVSLYSTNHCLDQDTFPTKDINKSIQSQSKTKITFPKLRKQLNYYCATFSVLSINRLMTLSILFFSCSILNALQDESVPLIETQTSYYWSLNC